MAIVNLWPEDGSKTSGENSNVNACRWSEITPALRRMEQETGRKINIMTGIHEGPEVLYRSGQNVVGTPHHRNTAGILDSFDFFTNKNMEQAFSILSKRDIDYLVFCKDSTEENVYLQTQGNTVVRMISEGRAPKWLVPVIWPSVDTSSFYIFHFNKNPSP